MIWAVVFTLTQIQSYELNALNKLNYYLSLSFRIGEINSKWINVKQYCLHEVDFFSTYTWLFLVVVVTFCIVTKANRQYLNKKKKSYDLFKLFNIIPSHTNSSLNHFSLSLLNANQANLSIRQANKHTAWPTQNVRMLCSSIWISTPLFSFYMSPDVYV